jgi:putative DNA primase/helicase
MGPADLRAVGHARPSCDPADAPDAEKEPANTSDPLKLNGIVPLASIPRVPIDWAWQGRFAFGKHTDVSGDPGDGKSLFLASLAAQVTRGFQLPFGSTRVREPRAVLYLSTEDDPADTIRPRVELAGGDLNLFHVQDDDHHLLLPDCADSLEEIIRRLNAGMVVIDPLFSFIGDRDPNSYADAVAVCDPLKKIASRTRCILASVRHLNKAFGAAARYRAGGSIGWQAKPRVALSLGRDPSDHVVRALTFIKGNVSGEPRAATFRVDEAQHGGEPVARVLWGEETDLSADEVHGTEGSGPKGLSKAEVLADFIRNRLRSAGEDGSPVDELRKEGGKGTSTFYAAKKLLRGQIIEFQRDPDRPRDPLRWRLADP